MDDFYGFNAEEQSFLRSILIEQKRFFSINEMVKVFKLVHFWSTSKLFDLAGSCFWNSEFTTSNHFSELNDQDLEIDPSFYEYFCNYETSKELEFPTDHENILLFNQANFHNPKDPKLFILLALCKNYPIEKLYLENDFPFLPYLLERIIARNPTLKSLNINFSTCQFFYPQLFPCLTPNSKSSCCFSSKKPTHTEEPIPFQFLSHIEHLNGIMGDFNLLFDILSKCSCLKSLEMRILQDQGKSFAHENLILQSSTLESLQLCFFSAGKVFSQFSYSFPKLQSLCIIDNNSKAFNLHSWNSFFPNISQNIPILKNFELHCFPSDSSHFTFILECLSKCTFLKSLKLLPFSSFSNLTILFTSIVKFLKRIESLTISIGSNLQIDYNMTLKMPNLKNVEFLEIDRYSEFVEFFLYQNPQLQSFQCGFLKLNSELLENSPNFKSLSAEHFEFDNQNFPLIGPRIEKLYFDTSFHNFQLHNLRDLTLKFSRNPIVSLSECLEQLPQLEKLTLIINKIISVVLDIDVISSLANLRHLRIFYYGKNGPSAFRRLRTYGARYSGTSLKLIEWYSEKRDFIFGFLEKFSHSSIRISYVSGYLFEEILNENPEYNRRTKSSMKGEEKNSSVWLTVPVTVQYNFGRTFHTSHRLYECSGCFKVTRVS